MDNIVQFSGEFHSPKSNAKQTEQPEHTAEIVLFPGVRYEHWDENDPDEIAQYEEPDRDFLEL